MCWLVKFFAFNRSVSQHLEVPAGFQLLCMRVYVF